MPDTPALDSAPISRVARNVTAIALATLIARGLQFVWAILLAQLLGEAGYGMWGVIGGMIATAAALPEFGMGLIVLRDVARDRAQAGKYLGATLAVQPPLAVVAYLLLIGASLLLPYDTAMRALIALAGISLLVDVLGTMGYNQLLAAEQMVTTSAILVAHIVAQIAFTFAVLMAGGGLPGLYVATILAGVFRMALFWGAMRRNRIRPSWPPALPIIRRLIRDGLPLALASFFGLAYQHVDKILVFSLLSEADAGYLTSAFVIVFGVIELTATTALTALFPVMSRLGQDQPAALRDITDRLALLILVITLPIGMGISTLSARLSGLLFPGFVRTSAVLEVLIWHAVVAMVASVYAQHMIIHNRQRLMVLFRVCGLILNAALNLILLPRLGVAGAGLASLITQIALLGLFLGAYRPDPAALRRLAGQSSRALLAGLGMGALIIALRDLSPILAGVCGMIAYLAGLLLFRALTPGDWALVRRVATNLPLIGGRIAARFPAS
jgi:O-antigen/teichoic acid export membrane protein